MPLEDKCIHTVKTHRSRLVGLRYNSLYKMLISVDKTGLLEYWDTNTFTFQQGKLQFASKIDTQLYDVQKKKQQVVGFALGNTGEYFSLMTRGQSVLVYSFGKGSVVSCIDESMCFYSE